MGEATFYFLDEFSLNFTIENTQLIFYKVVFEGVVGGNYFGDIGLDDIAVSDGPCTETTLCDFQTDLCQWTNIQDGTDKFDWLRQKGHTSSPYTGPSVDHSTGADTGYYVFAESSDRHLGDNARLASQVRIRHTCTICALSAYHCKIVALFHVDFIFQWLELIFY